MSAEGSRLRRVRGSAERRRRSWPNGTERYPRDEKLYAITSILNESSAPQGHEAAVRFTQTVDLPPRRCRQGLRNCARLDTVDGRGGGRRGCIGREQRECVRLYVGAG